MEPYSFHYNENHTRICRGKYAIVIQRIGIVYTTWKADFQTLAFRKSRQKFASDLSIEVCFCFSPVTRKQENQLTCDLCAEHWQMCSAKQRDFDVTPVKCSKQKQKRENLFFLVKTWQWLDVIYFSIYLIFYIIKSKKCFLSYFVKLCKYWLRLDIYPIENAWKTKLARKSLHQ